MARNHSHHETEHAMTSVSTNRANHVRGMEAQVAIAAALKGGTVPSDAVAATIASWYQTPTGHGLTFALLAQGTPVDWYALKAAIESEIGVNSENDRDMYALAMWLNSGH